MQEFDNLLQKPQSVHEVGSRFDRETSSDSLSTEQKEHATFGHRLSSPWRLQEPVSIDGPVISGASNINTSHSEGYSAALAGLPTSSSLARMAVRPHIGSSHIVTSGFGLSAKSSSGSTGTLGLQRFQPLGGASPSKQSPMRQLSPSPAPSLPGRYPHQQLQNSTEQDYPQSQSLSRPYYKAPQFSGNLLPSNVQHGNLRKLQSEDLQASSPSMPSFQSSRQFPLSDPRQPDSKESESSGQIQKPHPPLASKFGTPSTSGSSASDHSNPPTAEVSGQSSTSSLLAAVMKTGILSNITTGGLPNQSFEDVGKMSSQTSRRPPLPDGPPPSQFSSAGPKVTSASLSSPLSHDGPSTILNVLEKKEEQQALPLHPSPSSAQTPNAVNNASSPISNLLSSLVAKGLISASKSETPTQTPTQLQNQSPSISTPSSAAVSPVPVSPAIPHSSTIDEVSSPKHDVKSSVAMPQPTKVEIDNLIGLEFKPDVIRELHPPAISALFDDLPHRCSICGLQLKLKERLDRHLEWHNWKKTEPDGMQKLTRRWYADLGDWVTGNAGLPLGVESSSFVDEFGRTMDKDEPLVPTDEDQCVCILCGELFEDYYSQERNKWMFKGAVHMTIQSGDGEIGTTNESAKGPIVHVDCISESSLHDLGVASGIKMVR